MANVKKSTKVVETTTYDLTGLTEAEASVIMALVGKVGGTGEARTASGNLYNLLKSAGLNTHADAWMGEKLTLATKFSRNAPASIILD